VLIGVRVVEVVGPVDLRFRAELDLGVTLLRHTIAVARPTIAVTRIAIAVTRISVTRISVAAGIRLGLADITEALEVRRTVGSTTCGEHDRTYSDDQAKFE
jgi:hypothetical protein